MKKNLTIISLLSLLSPLLLANSNYKTLQTMKKGAKDNLTLNTKLKSYKVDGIVNKANIISFNIGGSGTFNMIPNLDLKINAGVKFRRGSSDSLYASGPDSNSDFYLSEAIIEYRPFERVRLQAGALDQGEIENSFVVSKTSFLGIKELVSFSTFDGELTLSAQQSIPNSKNNSNKIDKVEDGNPVFFFEEITYKKESYFLDTTLSVGHFAYDQLSNSSANSSRFYGNTITGLNESSADYKYSFIGWTAGANLDVKIDNFTFGLGGDYLINTAADTDGNQDFVLNSKFEIVSERNTTGLSTGLYEVASDSTPAIYSSSYYGNKNMKGAIITLYHHNALYDFNSKLSFRTSKPINKSLYQDKENTIYMEIRKDYDIL